MRSKITALEAEIRLSGKELKNDSGDIIHLKYLTKVDAATLVSCDKKASGKLVIPATIEGKPVTSIGKEAFSGCKSLTAVTFLGDAPDAQVSGENLAPIDGSTPTIYRKPEAKGWGDTWAGRPVKLISEKP